MNQPTEAALKLARRLVVADDEDDKQIVQARTQKLAAIIDRELLLPEKHAALLLAQGVADFVEDGDFDTEDLLDQIARMNEALSRIKSG